MISISSTVARKCGLCVSTRNGKLSLSCLVFVPSVIKNGPLLTDVKIGASRFLGFGSKINLQSVSRPRNTSLLINHHKFTLDFASRCYLPLEQHLIPGLLRFQCHYYCQSHQQTESNGKVTRGENCGNSSSEIMRVLNVAEKNDAAKRIANLLANGVVQTKNTFSMYNKLYEFQYHFMNQNCQMSMTSVSGHLLNCEFDQNYRKWHSCDPVELFDAPVNKYCQDNMKDIKRTLEQQAAYHSILIIWTDCDREGENIGYEVINVCKAVNPRLRVFRAQFSEITKLAVVRAMNNLVEPDKRVSDAVDVRQELDLRIGAAFTRFQTLRLTRKFPSALADRLISYGSCQFPTLGFVVERYKAIQDFIREDFWKIDVTHKVDDFNVSFSWARVKLFNRLAVQSIYEACLDDPMAKVTKVQSKPKSKWRPVALDTIELEKLASRKLRIGAKEAMQIAEQLYTKGFISYPRTETNIFPPGLDLKNLVQQQTESNQWGGFATRVLQQPNGPTPRNGKKTDQAHPPIHPTKFDNLNGLSDKHRKVYELICRHFLACCSKDALGKETIVEIEIAGEKFVANGLIVIERNYLEVYIYDKWSDKEIPDFHQDQTFRPTKIEMVDGRTSPPNLLTEADLIALMERHGIGTDATHAEHIETIKTRQYVGVQGIHFVPGKLGMGLVEGYDAMGFEMSKPHLRAELEADLQRICQGTRRPEDVLREQVQKYKQVFIHATDQVVRLDEALARLLNDMGPPPADAGGGGPRGGGVGGNFGGRRRGDDDDDDDGDSGFGGGNNTTVRSNISSTSTARSNASSTSSRSTPSSRTFISNNDSHRNQPTISQRPPAARAPARAATPEAGNAPLCGCDSVPDLLTTRKPGPNLGRQFYKCSTCGFFQWLDDSAAGGATSSTRGQIQRPGNSAAGYSSMGPPAPRVQQPVNNSNYQRNQQNFGSGSNNSDGRKATNQGATGEIPKCSCEKQAVSYTVRKEGANKGRKFFGCAVPFGSQEPRCDFFQWDDEGIGQSNTNEDTTRFAASNTHGSKRGAGANRSRGGNQGGARRPRKCGICHQEGHTRRNCPMAGGDDEDEEMDYSNM